MHENMNGFPKVQHPAVLKKKREKRKPKKENETTGKCVCEGENEEPNGLITNSHLATQQHPSGAKSH
jgi:hypothetical protein